MEESANIMNKAVSREGTIRDGIVIKKDDHVYKSFIKTVKKEFDQGWEEAEDETMLRSRIGSNAVDAGLLNGNMARRQ